MAKSAEFPLFIKAEYDGGGQGFAEFNRAVDGAMAGATRKARTASDEMRGYIRNALTSADGLARFDFGASKLRESAQAAHASAVILRQVANDAAAAEGATSAYAKQVAFSAAAAERHAAATNTQAGMLDRLEREAQEAALASGQFTGALEAQSLAAGRATGAQRSLQSSMAASRMAGVQIGQQFQDFAVQVAGGQNVLMAFTQQLSQVGFVAQGAGGTLGRVGSFIAGPWGSALFVGATAVGVLSGAFRTNNEAASAAKTGADALSSAQSVLGDIFDLTTGKLNRQNEVLLLNARLTAINLRGDAALKRSSSTKTLGQADERTAWGTAAAIFSRTGGSPIDRFNESPAAAKAIKDLMSNRISADAALKQIGELPDSAFSGTGATKTEVLQAIIDRAVAPYNERIADQIDKTLDQKVLDPAFSKASKGKKDRSAETLAKFGESAAERVQRINEQFDEQPRLIDRAAQAARELDKIIRDVEKRKPVGFAETVKDAEKAKGVVDAALTRPYREFMQAQAESLAIGELITQGRTTEAQALRAIIGLERTMGPLSAERKAAVLATVIALEQQSRKMEILQRQTQVWLDAVSATRDNVTATITDFRTHGFKAIGDFGGRFQQTMDRLWGDLLTEKLFGKAFRGLEDKLSGRDKIADASTAAAKQVDSFTSATEKATAALGSFVSGMSGANDNGGTFAGSSISTDLYRMLAKGNGRPPSVMPDGLDIVVTGSRSKQAADPKATFGEAFLKAQDAFATRLEDGLGDLFKGIFSKSGPFTAALGEKLGTLYAGAGVGMMAGGMILGDSGSRSGSGIGGSIGTAIGEKLAKGALGKTLGSLSSALGPLGAIAGGVLGGVIGSALKKTPTGSATIGVGANGQLVVTGLSGSSGKLRDAANENAQSSLTSIERIAEALGASVNSARGSVSIGFRDKSARVDTTGSGITKTKRGAIDFGSDVEAAVKFATLDLIKDGVLEGLRAGTQRLLQNSKDLEAGLDKALKFESIFTRLKAYSDPVGAALDALDKEFRSLMKVSQEASASSEEMAALEKFYGIKRREAVEEATASTLGGLRDFLRDLTVGENGRSLRDRRTAALAEYDPLRARVAAGDTTAFDAYATAAQTLLGIQRQISGSGEAFFALQDEMMALTRGAIAGVENLASISAGRDSIFSSLSQSTSVAVDNVGIIGAVDRMADTIVAALGSKLDASNRNLGAVVDAIRAAALGGGPGGAGLFQDAANF